MDVQDRQIGDTEIRERAMPLNHYPVDHVTDEACCGLVETGRNLPQKRFKLVERFCCDCGIIHGVISLFVLALRIIAKIIKVR
jgi:hypothetical protein